MRKRTLCLLSLGLFLCTCGIEASYPGACRAVNYGGKVCYISIKDDQKVAYFSGVVPPTNGGWKGPWGQDPVAEIAMPKDSYGKDFKRQDPNDYEEGQGVVLFGAQMIHFAVVFDSKSNPYLIVSRYDFTDAKFLDCKVLAPVPKTNHRGYGVAAAVYRDQIYVFTAAHTYSSGDGINYKAQPFLVQGLDAFEPMDAITFYPAQGLPKVMVAYIKDDSKGSLAFAIWEGSDLPLPASEIRNFGISSDRVRMGALVLGTVGGATWGAPYGSFPAGAKAPCIQALVLTIEDTYGHYCVRRYEYDITTDTFTHYGGPWWYYTIDRLWVYPWFETVAAQDGCPVQQQFIGIDWYQCDNWTCIIHSWYTFNLKSDFMVPQNRDGTYGWQGMPTPTSSGTQGELAVRRKYWSLLGVVLGGPPFEVNNLSEADIADISNVEYGSESTSSVEHSSSWSDTAMFSSETEVKEGIPVVAQVTETFDLSYKHAWEGEHSTTTTCTDGLTDTFGTEDEKPGPDWGTHGWAIFAAPTLLVQDTALYAYDYEVDSSPAVGTYLRQDLTTIVQATPPDPPTFSPLNVQAYYFSLQDPGGPDDFVPGLMTMQVDPGTGLPRTFPLSTDLASWSKVDWEQQKAPWEVLFGSGGQYGGMQVASLNQGTDTHYTFTTETETMASTGHTDSVDIKAGVGVEGEIELVGLKENLSAGYDGEWSSKTTNKTDLSEDIKFWLNLPILSSECTDPDCVDKLSVQPYFLVATDYTAPWIPAGYSLNLPWCIAWKVTNYVYKGGEQAGECPPPDGAGGTIAGRENGAEVSEEEATRVKWSDYSVKGGHMAWKGADGSLTPIPITADQFDPALGATVRLNRHPLRTDLSSGKWRKNGQVWHYKTNASIKRDVLDLKLDFGTGTWSFEGTKLSLSDHFRACESFARIELEVNGRYIFFCSIEHEVKADWVLKVAPSDPTQLEVTKYKGSFGHSGEEDMVKLEGTLPEALQGFGDLSLVLNGRQVDIPLLSQEDFWNAVEKGKEMAFEGGGTRVTVDFKKKTWSARFRNKAFEAIMVPRWGGARLNVKVGGSTWYSREHAVSTYTVKLKYAK